MKPLGICKNGWIKCREGTMIAKAAIKSIHVETGDMYQLGGTVSTVRTLAYIGGGKHELMAIEILGQNPGQEVIDMAKSRAERELEAFLASPEMQM